MSEIIHNRNISPYYDTTESESEKGYNSVLFKDGCRLQTRELNVLQGLIHNRFRRVTDITLEDGSIVSGCNFSNNTSTKICTISSGKLYLGGMIIDIPETSWTYSDDTEVVSQIPLGKVVIYAEILPVVYNAVDDNSLYNPSENYESFGDTGADRLSYKAVCHNCTESEYGVIATENSNVVRLLYITDRDDAVNAKDTPVFGAISKEMETRTYDQSGDFIASGLKISSLRNENNPEEYYKIQIAKGRCYVRGKKFEFDDKVIIYPNTNVNTDSTVASGIPEKITYVGSDYKYYLSHKSVKKIISIVGSTLLKNKLLTHVGGSGTTDVITEIANLGAGYNSSQVVGVSKVWRDNVSTETWDGVFVKKAQGETNPANYDYDNDTGNKIVWSLSGPHAAYVPAFGTETVTYNADIIYSTILTEGTDYNVLSDKSGSFIQFTDKIILAEGYTFDTNYVWYLSRMDLVYVNVDGIIAVKSGTAVDADILPEPIIPNGALPLAVIKVVPNKEPQYYTVNQYGLYRVPIAKLHDMNKRIENLEYNVTMTTLEQEVQNKHLEQDSLGSTTLKNIYTDPIVDYTKADTKNNNFKATMDIFKNYVVLPMVIDQIGYNKCRIRKVDAEGNIKEVNPDTNNIGVCNRQFKVSNSNDIEYIKIANMTQVHATDEMDITPFVYKGLTPTIACEPNKLCYVEDDENTTTVWLPNRVIYSTSYVDSLVNTVKNYTGTTVVTYNTTTD